MFNLSKYIVIGGYYMDIKKLIEIVDGGETRFCFHLAYRKRNDNLDVVSATTKDPLNFKIRRIVVNKLKKVSEMDQNPYNVVGKNDDTIEIAECQKYSQQIKVIIDAINNPTVNFKFKSSNFDFFIYEFRYDVKNAEGNDDEKSILCFRKTKNLKYLQKGFWGRLEEGSFNDIREDDILGVDDSIDFIIYDGEALILQHMSFENILKLKNEFLELAKKTLSSEAFSKRIVNFDKLKEGALNNRSYIKRLSKLNAPKNDPTKFLDPNNIDKTKEVINDFNLDIKFDKNDNLIYENETQLGNFINLMQDSYYKTLIGERYGADERS